MTSMIETVLQRSLLVATVGVAAFALSGCSILGNIVGGNGATVVEGEGDQTDVFTIAVGDCLNDSSAGETVTSVPAVDCNLPHDSEVYASIIIPDGEYPGVDAVKAQADADCTTEFDAFVGMAYADSILDFQYYYPTAETWGNGDREIVCLIVDTDGSGNLVQATGTLAGAAR
jgi:hypothetical protein